MKTKKEYFRIKAKFQDYFSKHKVMQFGEMFFRLYNPFVDEIVSQYSRQDWNKIFINTTEDDIKDLSTCSNVVILIWCESITNSARGMVYLEENYNNPREVKFHGGTWDHNPKFYFRIFQSIVKLFDFILTSNVIITTSCTHENTIADKFQRSLGFEEVDKDNTTIYKILNNQKFKESDFVNTMRIRKQ